MKIQRDSCLDTLLLLDGEVFVTEGKFRVKFLVKEVPATPEKPHGLDYSLTLHDGGGERLLGFDNAHSTFGHYPLVVIQAVASDLQKCITFRY